MSRRNGRMRVAAAASAALLFMLPLLGALWMSLQPIGTLSPTPTAWPPALRWDNYRAIFAIVALGQQTRNSLLVVALAVPLTLLVAAPAGFALSQLPGRARRRLVALSLVALLIPAAAVWILRFRIYGAITIGAWSLLNTPGALIAPALAGSSPLFILLYYWAFRRVPAELYEAAQLDGANALAVLRHVALPLARPTTLGVTLLTFVLYWNDFVSPVLYTYEPADYTLPVGVQLLKQLDATAFPLLMAAAVYMTLPVIILVAYLQRQFLRDLTLAEMFNDA